MPDPLSDVPVAHWPLFGLRLHCDDVHLRPVREHDLPLLTELQPHDYEHDPSAPAVPGEELAEHRRRLVYQGYWRSLGTWSPASWCLDFAVEHDGTIVGVQSLEAADFLDLRTVDSGSWLVESARGRGIGIAMRTAVLALAFDHLGALAAVTSARSDNAASLGVSRHVGYRDNGVSLNQSGRGLVELAHMRLTAEEWRASGAGGRVTVSGVDPCRRWFGLSSAH
ncbi:GNAT family N-acetyltransferase [Nocardioides pinisoli]|uniref:GNAT family N-acetyltransferase n=1 Tax=Nocardioides pinisoli TaxID=2950279 RepID=UPI0020B45D26|nr:GNAT family protein [Nocardioides pinisoli]